jgi:ATP/maltotriose-dependent transcriptional regulator MalT
MKESIPITNRETGIMLLLGQGFSNEQIAQATGISVNTVKYHLKRVYKKLHVQNRVEAINKFNSVKHKVYAK